MIKVGIISSVNAKTGTARVLFPDRGESVSGDIAIVVPFTLSAQAYYMPDVGERVVCIFDDNNTGFILGSFFSENRLPNNPNKNNVYVDFGDGTLIQYNKEKKVLDFICKSGEINIMGKKVTVMEI